jgi:hypothetical protein
MARATGFAFSSWREGGGYFAEALVAKELHDDGWTCWQANMCHLFLKSNRQGQAKAQTDIVEGMLAAEGHPRPRDYKGRLSFKPRDPDLIARHPGFGWRFCEVKWKSERLRAGQLETLAFLHHLLGAIVEVVRVIPAEHRVKSAEKWDCTYTLRPTGSSRRAARPMSRRGTETETSSATPGNLSRGPALETGRRRG